MAIYGFSRSHFCEWLSDYVDLDTTKNKIQTIATIYYLLFAEENFHYLHSLIINHETLW